jgi:hypothetical protein
MPLYNTHRSPHVQPTLDVFQPFSPPQAVAIPAELGQLGALADLYLGQNELSGAIPAELGQLGALAELSLSQNELSGPIPAELGQLGALTHLYLDENQLTGQEAFGADMEEHHPDCALYL